MQGEDLRGVDDGGVETGLGRLVQKDAVEHLARGRVESEGDVGESEDRAHARQLGLHRARIASIVSMPSRRDSTMPVESGSASVSMKMSWGSRP